MSEAYLMDSQDEFETNVDITRSEHWEVRLLKAAYDLKTNLESPLTLENYQDIRGIHRELGVFLACAGDELFPESQIT